MKSSLPFYPQETPDSCVPACLRMVLASFGQMLTEAELCRMCDCTIFGTDAFQAVEAVRKLGFLGSRKCNLSIAELDELLKDGFFPIVYVSLMPIDQTIGTHAMVVVLVADNDLITLLDPLSGERKLERSVLYVAWRSTNGLTIVVSE